MVREPSVGGSGSHGPDTPPSSEARDAPISDGPDLPASDDTDAPASIAGSYRPAPGGGDGEEPAARSSEPPPPPPAALVVATVLLALAAGVVIAVGLAHWGRAEAGGPPRRFDGGNPTGPGRGEGTAGADTRDRPAPRCLDGRRRLTRLHHRPAVAVKVDNSPAGRPQGGLEDADVVFEEIAEGGITRFLAIYDCGDNRRVGPVRSARVDDGALARPFTRVLAYSGANKPVQHALAESHTIRRTELDSPAFHRIPPGSTDIYSLTLDTKQLRRTLERTPARPPQRVIFTRGAQRNGKKVRRVSINFTPSNTIEYRWRRGLWRRYEAGEPFRTRAGGLIAIPNLLVQRVEVDRSDKIVDVAGNPSPDIRVVGRGKALLFRDGAMTSGRWVRRRPTDAPRFELSNGRPMAFDLGPVWVELLPSKTGEVKGSLSFR